jgi:hypothetical protein
MRIAELFENVLLEQIDMRKALEKYANDPSIYVSYTNLPKIGINPKFDFGTPLGIYAYPLRNMWFDIKSNDVPFGGNRKYIQILKAGPSVIKAETYNNFEADCRKLYDLYGKEFISKYKDASDPEKIWKFFVDHASQDAEHYHNGTMPIVHLWGLTHKLANFLAPDQRSGLTVVTKWNSIFRALGYGGISDGGMGLIHANEPAQVIFFSKSAFQHIGMVDNVRKITQDLSNHEIEDLNDLIEIINEYWVDHDSSDRDVGAEGNAAKMLHQAVANEWLDLFKTGSTAHFKINDLHTFWSSVTMSEFKRFARMLLKQGKPGTVAKLIQLIKEFPQLDTSISNIVELAAKTPGVRMNRADFDALYDPEFTEKADKEGVSLRYDRNEIILRQAVAQLVRGEQFNLRRAAEKMKDKLPLDYGKKVTPEDVKKFLGAKYAQKIAMEFEDSSIEQMIERERRRWVFA